MSLVEPDLKPHLIDRYIASAGQGELTPIVCLNKADLVDAELLQPHHRFVQPARDRRLSDQRRDRPGIGQTPPAPCRPSDGVFRSERRG